MSISRPAPAPQLVDKPPGRVAAEPQPPLEHRGRRRLHLRDEPDRVAQQRILVGIEAVLRAPLAGRGVLRAPLVGGGVLRLLEQLLAELRLALPAPLVRKLRDLLLVDVGALDALQP